jgi:imidazolonepropionase-like amidohydrolase
MTRAARLLASLLILSGSLHAQQPVRRSPPIAIVHATVLTMADSVPIRDGTVLIDRARIVAVGPGRSVAIPAGSRIIDATGKFVIPGLWDMHVHTAVPGGEPLLGLFIAHGVTGVRDMGGDLATIKRWRARIRAGTLAGPRIVASGPYVQGGSAALPHFVVRTPGEARAAVDSLARLGADFVKVHEMVPREAFFALARAARDHGLFLAGHLQSGVMNEEAADSGQRSLEHLNGFANSCSPADSVRLSAAYSLHLATLGECSTVDQSSVYRHIAARPTWVTPTLVALEMIAALPGERLPSDTLQHYLSPTLREAMAAALEIPTDMPADANVLGRALWNKRLDVVRGLAANGVPLLAGTDAPLPNSIPGFGFHTELEELVRAGLSPWEALRAATVEPAHYFATDSIGTIRAGAVADLVVLDANPIDDIRNTRRISLVVAAGRLFSAEARRALETRAIRAAAGR